MADNRPWNFIIHFHSREGSSAIVNMLSQQTGVRVPLFEALDRHNYQREHTKDQIYGILENIFKTGVYEDLYRAENAIRTYSMDEPFQVIGFKWRSFGKKRKLAKILRANHVKLFFLTRKDFDETVASSYFHAFNSKKHTNSNIEFHPQFRFLESSEAEKQKLRKAYSDITVPIRNDLLRKIRRNRSLSKWSQFATALRFRVMGVSVKQLFYEDFAMDNVVFIDSFLREINILPEEDDVKYSSFEKVYTNPHQDRIEGFGRAKRSFGYRVDAWRYRLSYTLLDLL